MKNEKILIIGDSYSTFEGYIPDGYLPFYPKTSSDEVFDVSDVSNTWWHMLAQETNSEIVLNNSWSGSTICNTGYGGDCSKTSSFIYRLTQLIDNGFFSENKIDRVFVFGATNDSCIGVDCGELKFSDWTADDLKLVLPGICYFIHKLTSVISAEKIHFIINTHLKQEIRDGILKICNNYNVGYTKLSNIEKVNGHPNCKGMVQIKDQVLSNLNS